MKLPIAGLPLAFALCAILAMGPWQLAIAKLRASASEHVRKHAAAASRQRLWPSGSARWPGGSPADQDLSCAFLRRTDTAETLVVTFGEVVKGSRTGSTKRQYWMRRGSQWKIFFEGVTG